MENIFKKSGFNLSKSKNHPTDQLLHLMWMNNPDGSPRWIWNAENKHPTFLKFYNKGSKRASIIEQLIRLVFFLRIQGFIFPSQKFYFPAGAKTLFDCQSIWALFTGTIGPNNKAVLFANESFYKIALTEQAKSLLEQEHAALKLVENHHPSFAFPQSCSIAKDVLQLSDISGKGIRTTALTPVHFKALESLNKMEQSTLSLQQWGYFQELVEEFHYLSELRIPNNLKRKIKWLLSSLNQQEAIECSYAQGDFTSWNMYSNGELLSIYDWELARTERSLGFDYYHYIFQNGIMVDRKSWKNILEEMEENLASGNLSFLFQNKEERNKYLKYYLLIISMEYLKIYAKQKDWHPQISWLFQVWNEAFNYFLSDNYSQRELLIMDFFDFLHNESYATLKFPHQFPELLKTDADIDLVISAKQASLLEKYIRQHAFVSNVSSEKKSFKNTLQINTNDQEILFVDLLFAIKRKNLFLFSATKIIARSMHNQYGVKIASALDTARFIAAFYMLNNKPIPQHYLHYAHCLLRSDAKEDKVFRKCYSNGLLTRPELLHMVHNRKENSGLQKISGQFIYAIDSVKTALFHRGFIISFSGVDGAGKSTLIEKTVNVLEKQFRKRVIVLRHRPSLLPILSVWSKGKEKAHQDTIESLPRQGKNQSILSSLFRFAYYYSDYLFGQFFIHCKYILRGYVVVYDRYYFDFIIDGKRSNIRLPKWLPLIAYSLLFKPKFNFFLYADAETILKRKKELSQSTIEELTAEYRLLFDALQSKSKKAQYISIKNEILETSIDKIVNTLKHNS